MHIYRMWASKFIYTLRQCIHFWAKRSRWANSEKEGQPWCEWARVRACDQNIAMLWGPEAAYYTLSYYRDKKANPRKINTLQWGCVLRLYEVRKVVVRIKIRASQHKTLDTQLGVSMKQQVALKLTLCSVLVHPLSLLCVFWVGITPTDGWAVSARCVVSLLHDT